MPKNFRAKFVIDGKVKNGSLVTMYDGHFHKQEGMFGSWTIEGELRSRGHRLVDVFTVKDSKVYWHSEDANGKVVDASCPTGRRPALVNSLHSAMGAALLHMQANVAGVAVGECADHDKWVVEWTGLTYVFCRPAKGRFQFSGEQFAAHITEVAPQEQLPTVTVPRTASGGQVQCGAGPSAGRRLLARAAPARPSAPEHHAWYKAESTSAGRKLGAAYDRCLFVHGLGQNKGLTSATVVSSYDYWMDSMWETTEQYMTAGSNPACGEVRFLKYDSTVDNGWMDPVVRQQFCDKAKDGSDKIRNTAVFSHSMGNLVVGKALQSGTCALASSSKWFGIEGPLGGSQAAGSAQSVCDGSFAPGWLNSVLLHLTEVFYPLDCFQDGNGNWMAGASMSSLVPSNPNPYGSGTIQGQLDSLASTYQNKMSGMLCGVDSSGLDDSFEVLGWRMPDTWALPILSSVVSNDDDGMVRKSECKKYLTGKDWKDGDDGYWKWWGWKSTYSTGHPWNIMEINHADGTGRNGNGWYGADRQPMEWMKKMAKNV